MLMQCIRVFLPSPAAAICSEVVPPSSVTFVREYGGAYMSVLPMDVLYDFLSFFLFLSYDASHTPGLSIQRHCALRCWRAAPQGGEEAAGVARLPEAVSRHAAAVYAGATQHA